MSRAKTREKVLTSIRQALSKPTTKPVLKPDFQSDIYSPVNEDPAYAFAEKLILAKGEFIFCESRKDLLTQLSNFLGARDSSDIRAWEPEIQEILKEGGIGYISNDIQLENIEVGITACECLIVRTGSLFVSSRQFAGRRLTIYPPVHIVIAYTSQLWPDIKEGIMWIKEKYKDSFPSMLTLVSGPSRTADIEKTLVLGAHGPKELIVFLVDDTPVS